MAIDRPLKIGDKLKNCSSVGLYVYAEVKGLNTINGAVYVWLLTETHLGEKRMLTFREDDVVDGWSLAPDFFVKDGIYGHPGVSSTSYKIKNVYEVENGISDEWALAAVAEVTNYDGKRWLTILNIESFDCLVELPE